MGGTGRRICLGTAFAIAIFAVGTKAQQTAHTFGAMTLILDDRDWSFVPEGQSSWRLEPVEDKRRNLRTIRISVQNLEGGATCKGLAEAALAASAYTAPKSFEIVVSEIQAVRAEAHTRCRNATPLGVVVCIPHAGLAHVFANTIVGCRSAGNPFSKGSIDRVLASVRPAAR